MPVPDPGIPRGPPGRLPPPRGPPGGPPDMIPLTPDALREILPEILARRKSKTSVPLVSHQQLESLVNELPPQVLAQLLGDPSGSPNQEASFNPVLLDQLAQHFNDITKKQETGPGGPPQPGEPLIHGPGGIRPLISGPGPGMHPLLRPVVPDQPGMRPEFIQEGPQGLIRHPMPEGPFPGGPGMLIRGPGPGGPDMHGPMPGDPNIRGPIPMGPDIRGPIPGGPIPSGPDMRGSIIPMGPDMRGPIPVSMGPTPGGHDLRGPVPGGPVQGGPIPMMQGGPGMPSMPGPPQMIRPQGPPEMIRPQGPPEMIRPQGPPEMIRPQGPPEIPAQH